MPFRIRVPAEDTAGPASFSRASFGVLPPALALAMDRVLAAAAPTGAQAGCGEGSGPDLALTNLSPNEVVGHELLLIKGILSPGSPSVDKVGLRLDTALAGKGTVAPQEADAPGSPRLVSEWPAGGGRFKALAHLRPGPNRIMLSAAGHRTLCLDISYRPNPSPYKMRLVFVLARDGKEGSGVIPAAPGDLSDLASAKARLAFGALLMETAMAELLREAGKPRRTVGFKRDAQGRVEVTVFHSSRSEEFLRGRTADQLWEIFHAELDSAYQDGRTKFLSMLGGFGSGALGGRNQAMFGTATLYSWAQGLDELTARFSDPRKPGDFRLEDESAFRNSFWANYSTGIGATLHELGHALGLPNSGEANDIMERGFDRFNRIFMLREDGELIADEAVHYAASSAALLLQSPWVLPPAGTGLAPRGPAGAPRLGREGNRLVLDLPAGAEVSLDLFDLRGARAARIFSGRLAEGRHGFPIPALAPGLYVGAAKAEGAPWKAIARLPVP